MMIKSQSNKKIKLVKSLAKKKYRDLYNMFIVEGERFVDDIPKDVKIETTLVSKSFSDKKDISNYINCEVIEDKIFDELTDTTNSQGILAVCHKIKPELELIDIKENAFILIGDRVQDPGNVGTIIRTAVASGVDFIVFGKGSVDIYNQKVIRSTASAIFSIPIIEEVEIPNFLQSLKRKNVKIFGAHLKATDYYFNSDFNKSIAIIIGNEANGMSSEVADECTDLVKIPMLGEIESLNAGVSSAIIMYEVVRQRIK